VCSENLLKGDIDRSEDGCPRVLVIEGDHLLGENLLRYIERHMGWAGCLASSLEQARLLLESEPHFDIVVTDMQVRGSNCIEFIPVLKARMCKVIVTSGSVNLLPEWAIRAKGADDFLAKPFSLQDLKDRMTVLLPQKSHHAARSLKLSVKRPKQTRKSTTTSEPTGLLSSLPRLSACQQVIARELEENFGQVVERAALFPKAFHEDYTYGDRSLDAQVFKIRSKLEKQQGQDCERALEIASVYGVGYILRYKGDGES
jgi:DNA-binding response OmpR family regulator